MAAKRYRWIGDYPQEFTLGEGDKATSPVVGPGEYIELDTASGDDIAKALNQEFVNSGLLIEAPEETAKGGKT